MDELLKTTGVEELLYKLTILMLVVLGTIVLLVFSIIWAKFSDLPAMSKVGLVLALVLIALVVIWIMSPELLEDNGVTAEALQSLIVHIWREVDGFARSHRWIGLVLLASIPFLLWPSHDETAE